MSKSEKLPENIKPEMIGEKRYVRISEGARRYSVSPNTFRMMAAEAHAIIHVRRIVLIDTKMIDEYLEAFREEQTMKFNYIYGKQAEQYDYLYIPKAFMKQNPSINSLFFDLMFSIIDIKCVYVYNSEHKNSGRIKVKKAAYNILPETEDTLKTLGEQIKLARLRRDLSATLVAERAGISRASLWKVESGNPAVAIGIYAAVLHALGNMDKDFLLVAKDDERGRQMQDLGLLTKKRASRRKE